MASLSNYLFWTGMVTAGMAALLYFAYIASASLAVRRMTAQTNAGTVTVTTGGGGTPNPGIGRLATTFTAFTALFLAGWVVTRWSATGHTPLSNLYEFTTAFGFAIAVSYLAFETTQGNRRFGVLALPIVVAMLFIASLFPNEINPLIPALQNGPLLTIHVSVIMLSYAVLTVAFVGAAVYLVQGGEGRRWSALPSAEAAGDLAHKAVMVGFPLLGLGIALGAWWANSAWGRYWGWDPKETSALVTWLSIVAYFHARAGSGSVAGAPGIRRIVPEKVRRGWRPDPMWWLIAMWGLVMFTYFGVNLWISGLHSYAGV